MTFPGPTVKPLMPEDYNPSWQGRPAPGAGVYVPPETRSERQFGTLGRLARLAARWRSPGEDTTSQPHTPKS